MLECAGTERAFHHTGHFMSPGWGLLLNNKWKFGTNEALADRVLREAASADGSVLVGGEIEKAFGRLPVASSIAAGENGQLHYGDSTASLVDLQNDIVMRTYWPAFFMK